MPHRVGTRSLVLAAVDQEISCRRATISSARRFRGGLMMNLRPLFSSLAAGAFAIATVSAADAASCGGSFETWLAEFKSEAAAKGISQGAIAGGLSGVTPDPRVLSRER